ncbi:uncharacterized protein N7477_009093 [Penicillium maclennaniae]|uniref:uncharacterized protein n=1 Tax=Penicillium maclennaniae TaxID=1343394 RepID=UPI00254107CA|nr:uncharacterized protein N7477_009093 [Penicillium maclennaniae]KAJ5661477.1 hypothetical protein N7477_009093 [Penicillium maclennaniae]
MADVEIPKEEETPRTPYTPNQNVRTNGRAFNSANWRTKGDSPQASPSPRTITSRSAFSRPGPHVPQAISEGRRLYVGNMPYTAKTEDVEALFTAAQYSVERIDIAIDPFTGRNPSYCFVDLQTKEAAERAMIELDGRDMQGRAVRVKPGVTKSASERTDDRSGERTGEQSRGASNNIINARWRSPATAVTPPPDSSQRVYVGGLPRVAEQETVESNMKNFFSEFRVEAISKLFAPHPAKRFDPGDHYYLFVELDTAEEAQRAMDTLNGQTGPWGGPLRVNRARGPSQRPGERKEEIIA